MRYLLGIDNGGTFCKAALFDEDGNQLAVQSESSVTFSPQPGFAERDMEEMYLSNVRAIRGAVKKSGIDPKVVSELLGHSSVTITLNRYVHPTMEMKKRSVERLLR